MRVLLISQAYPPFPAVGALRADKLAKMFCRHGHEVTVIAERTHGADGRTQVQYPNLTVHTVEAGLPYRLRLVALRNRMIGRSVPLSSWDGPPGGASPGPTRSRRSALRPLARTVKDIVVQLMRLPDDQLQFVPPAFRAATRVMHQGVDIVYTTAPAFSTHLVGLLLQRHRARWIAEFRDPWTNPDTAPARTALPRLIQRLNRVLERRCLHGADAIVAVTETVARQLAAKLPPNQRHKVVVAMNGIGELAPPRAASEPNGPFRIVHAGSFYHDRDPRPFLEALAAWMKGRELGRADVQVEFAGRCRYYADVSVERFVKEAGLAEIVRFHDWLPHDEVERMLREADLVLLLARSQPAQVPNKLFDYLGARAPILAVVDAGGESARILEAVGGQHVITVTDGEPVPTAELGEAIERAYLQRGKPPATDEAALQSYLTERQMARLADAIGA